MLTLTSQIDTYAHRIPAGAKMAGFAGLTLLLFAVPQPWLLALPVATLIVLCGADFARQSLRALRPLIPLIVLLALWHLWLRDPQGITIITRMIIGVAAANFVTMTSTLTDLTRVIERLARPLGPLISPKTLALAVGLTIRFVPTMLIRADQITESWRARSAKRPGWRVVLPSTLGALDDAAHTAEALRARGGL
ncbi:MAG: energy-coupling factor transporter transmembrane protein EcfT [Microgenomates group bacterium]